MGAEGLGSHPHGGPEMLPGTSSLKTCTFLTYSGPIPCEALGYRVRREVLSSASFLGVVGTQDGA